MQLSADNQGSRFFIFSLMPFVKFEFGPNLDLSSVWSGRKINILLIFNTFYFAVSLSVNFTLLFMIFKAL